jgi:arylsulfatase A-like enzyme
LGSKLTSGIIFYFIILLVFSQNIFAQNTPVGEKPNILFIAVDDLNDWTGYLGGHPQAKTPNIDRLASMGVAFTHAYCSAPLCNPSRISLLTGVLPSNSGVYGNGERLREKLPDATTLMQYLRQYGYNTQGGGKIFHGTDPGDIASWDFYFKAENFTLASGRDSNLPKEAWAPWGAIDVEDEEMLDVKVVNWTISELEKSHDKPFFLACGFTKPHLPWYVPQKYFDLHPLDGIELPPVMEGDLDDVPAFGKKLAREVYDPSGERNFAVKPDGDHANVIANNQWHKGVQAYLATISFVDAYVGKLLEALENSEYADNTIVVLWGDHGWHLGEKHHWRKHALWENTTRTPLIISVPGKIEKNHLCKSPVSFIDIYPTLIELCGLPEREELDGKSFVPLLQNPDAKWDKPVLTTYGKGNHAIRTERWRYIHYFDGTEELYDHQKDPEEWKNLAEVPKYRNVIKELKNSLPKTKKN